MSQDKLTGLLLSMRNDLLNDETLTEKKRVISNGSSATGSEGGSVVINKYNEKNGSEDPLRIRTKNFDTDDEDADDFNDYIIEPQLPPPKELHPGKLYALFEFTGDDPSHCGLQQDDAVVLLNDQDNYWWLVRKEINGKIGFAPAECLETYDERLARLNCWKNEELERTSKENLEFQQLDEKKYDSKLSKSVTFSNEIIVAEEVDDSDVENNEIEDDDIETNHLDPLRHNYEEIPYVGEDDEIISDNFPVTPLLLGKKSERSFNKPQQLFQESDIEDASPLVAPNAFFMQNNHSGSIGEYSPSSSEFDSPENTPPLPKSDKIREEAESIVKKANIPLSRGTRDIAHSIKMLDDLINDELNTNQSLESFHDSYHSELDPDRTLEGSGSNLLLSSPISINGSRKNFPDTTEQTCTISNGSLYQLNSSSTTVEFDQAIFPKPSELEPSPEIHPEIKEIFAGTLTQMDELTERLKLLTAKFKE